MRFNGFSTSHLMLLAGSAFAINLVDGANEAAQVSGPIFALNGPQTTQAIAITDPSPIYTTLPALIPIPYLPPFVAPAGEAPAGEAPAGEAPAGEAPAPTPGVAAAQPLPGLAAPFRPNILENEGGIASTATATATASGIFTVENIGGYLEFPTGTPIATPTQTVIAAPFGAVEFVYGSPESNEALASIASLIQRYADVAQCPVVSAESINNFYSRIASGSPNFSLEEIERIVNLRLCWGSFFGLIRTGSPASGVASAGGALPAAKQATEQTSAASRRRANKRLTLWSVALPIFGAIWAGLWTFIKYEVMEGVETL